MASKKSFAGYCRLHKKKLCYKDMKENQCLDPIKQNGSSKCKHLKQYPEHPIWKTLADEAKRKEERRVNRRLKNKEQAHLTSAYV